MKIWLYFPNDIYSLEMSDTHAAAKEQNQQCSAVHQGTSPSAVTELCGGRREPQGNSSPKR